MNFIDEIKINVIGGDGGHGNLGYIKFKKHYLPYGGRGGHGGDIYIVADNNINTLNFFKFTKHFKANNGSNGKKNFGKGKNGNTLLIKVPIWTEIYFLNNKNICTTLTFNKQKILIAKGGHYGLGSKSYFYKQTLIKKSKSSHYFLGKQGENLNILLRLILKNDITILGIPNSGKSTIFNQLTNTYSKVDYYPYTTTIPYKGILKQNNLYTYRHNITILDLPNILDIKTDIINNYIYLKHIKYCKLILFVIDITTSSQNLFKIYWFLKHIKLCFSNQILDIWLIVNKIDLIKQNKDYKFNILTNIKNLLIKTRYYFISTIKHFESNILFDDIINYFKTHSKYINEKNTINNERISKFE